MQTEVIDLLQFHWWTFQHPGWLDAMHELARLKDEGLIRHLGTTNFDTDHLYVLAREGHPDRDQPGLLFAARPSRRRGDGGVLRRGGRSSCSPMARLPAAC